MQAAISLCVLLLHSLLVGYRRDPVIPRPLMPSGSMSSWPIHRFFTTCGL